MKNDRKYSLILFIIIALLAAKDIIAQNLKDSAILHLETRALNFKEQDSFIITKALEITTSDTNEVVTEINSDFMALHFRDSCFNDTIRFQLTILIDSSYTFLLGKVTYRETIMYLNTIFDVYDGQVMILGSGHANPIEMSISEYSRSTDNKTVFYRLIFSYAEDYRLYFFFY